MTLSGIVVDAVEEGRGEKTGYGERADEGEKSGDRLLLCMDATDGCSASV